MTKRERWSQPWLKIACPVCHAPVGMDCTGPKKKGNLCPDRMRLFIEGIELSVVKVESGDEPEEP